MREEKSAGGVVFYNDQRVIKFLLIKSSYWGFPKGWIEKGESSESAARREIKEETNLDVNFLPHFTEIQKFSFKFRGERIHKEIILFLAEIPKEEVKNVKISLEHGEFRWVTFEQGIELMKIKNNKELLGKAMQYIKQHGKDKKQQKSLTEF